MVTVPPNPNLAYAVQMVHATCCLAGSASYLDDIRADRGISRAVRDHDTPALFDWLIEALSFQGISDSVASGYIARHGSVRWSEIAAALSRNPSCPKLAGYWPQATPRALPKSTYANRPSRSRVAFLRAMLRFLTIALQILGRKLRSGNR